MITNGVVTETHPYETGTPEGTPGYYDLSINSCLVGNIVVY